MDKIPTPQEIRLWQLNDAIEQNPDAAVNFVLRGEYYLSMGNKPAAIQDFQHAIELAEDEWLTSPIGYLLQLMIDRAEQGLKLALEL